MKYRDTPLDRSFFPIRIQLPFALPPVGAGPTFNHQRRSNMATTKKAPAPEAPAKKAAPAAKKATAPAAAKAAAPAKKAASSAFMKALTPSEALAAVVGKAPLPRTEVVKKLWEYIKKHKLQDAANKKQINADAKLKAVFGKPSVDMFEMTKLVSQHLK
ncbi:MAG: hypothetical protein Fur007_15630 [Rhodoferax sp.]